MKKSLLFHIVLLFTVAATAQKNGFDPVSYRQFLFETQSLSAIQLAARYPAGRFEATVPIDWRSALYADSITVKYQLTGDEKKLLGQNGFMVSERLSHATFINAFADIWHKDLPLFISADAILHAVHISYDEILKEVELNMLIPHLQSLLASLHGGIPDLGVKYQGQPELQPMIRDVDLYLAIARRLLDGETIPLIKENRTAFTQILGMIDGLQPVSYPLFAEIPRKIDFSQFQVRGHYTSEFHPELARYFRAMMWLGRTELYLIAPEEADTPPTFSDVQRQIIDALLLQELLVSTGSKETLQSIDRTLAFLVGECDNVTPDNLQELTRYLGINTSAQLLDSLQTIAFQNTLAKCPFAWQRITSQLLVSDPLSPDTLRPASSFLLLGQRFIIDSYITSQVVYDKISYRGQKVTRMLPSTLDVLFGLGNDAAGQLLQEELDEYHYAPNLAAVRYLVDSYDETFWQSSLFNPWLAAIRSLTPPADRAPLPPTMRTAAWWQRVMNSQLGSWTELRHDNLLYAKQSYSGMTICSYPEVYIEPVPELYASLARMARAGADHFTGTNIDLSVAGYFRKSAVIFDTLRVIAGKMRATEPLSAAEDAFLKRALKEELGCGGGPYSGWYPELYIQSYETDGAAKVDLLVADVHTSPTDAFGTMVGWVKHVGTGPINLGVIVLPLEGKNIAFVAPMMSYYEHLTTNFERLTDERWAEIYQLAPSLRPDFVNAYLADEKGYMRSGGVSLLTGVKTAEATDHQPGTPILAANWPNPFNAETLIRISIPAGYPAKPASLAIYDRLGRKIQLLFAGPAASGHYLTRWDGCDESGQPVPSGIYFYRFTLEDQVVEGRMSLVR